MQPDKVCDQHQLFNCDCMDYLASVPDGTFDLIYTDVPYKQEFHGRGMSGDRPNYRKINAYGSSKDLDYTGFFELCLAKLKKVNFFTFCDKETKFDFIKMAKEREFGYKELCFCKTSPTPFCASQWLPDVEFGLHIFKGIDVIGNYHTKRSFFVMENFKEPGVPHPSAKKVDIVHKVLLNISLPGWLVCDPFMGSGTTALACHRAGRVFVGVEKDPDYFKLAWQRLESETRQLQLF